MSLCSTQKVFSKRIFMIYHLRPALECVLHHLPSNPCVWHTPFDQYYQNQILSPFPHFFKLLELPVYCFKDLFVSQLILTWIDEHIIYYIAYEFDILDFFFLCVILFSVLATFDSLCLSSVVWPNFPAFIVTILFLCTNLHLLLHPRKTGYLPLNPRDPGKMLTVPSVNACTECVKKKISVKKGKREKVTINLIEEMILVKIWYMYTFKTKRKREI